MPTLAEFYANISGALKRGTSQDARIPEFVRLAARQLEENYSFKHMERFGETTLNPLAVAPERVDLPTEFVKAITYVRFAWISEPNLIGEQYNYIEQVDPRDFLSTDYGVISGYYLDGQQNKLVLDGIPAQPAVLQWAWTEYTDWPGDTSQTPELLKVAESALKYKTLLDFAIDLKDPRMAQEYGSQLQFALSTSLRAQEEGKQANKTFVMRPRLVF